MKGEVSILLNLAGCLNLEEADPLMSLLSGKGRLLFYDQLSVRRFPTDRSQYEHYLETLLSSMRNLLESRTLSTEDGGEDVRLIVTLDLAQGMFEPAGGQRMCLPAQKERLFKAWVKEVFGEDNPLLARFRYCFLFLEGTLQSTQKLASFYRTYAFDGITGDSPDWMSPGDFCLAPLKKKAMAQMKDADEDVLLEDSSVKAAYQGFLSQLNASVDKLAGYLDRLEAGGAFRDKVGRCVAGLRSVKDFRETDFDRLLRETVTGLVGLSSREFGGDCTFFLRFTPTPAAIRRRDEIQVLSLVMTLVTLRPEDFSNMFRSESPSVFVIGSMMEGDLDEKLLVKLQESIQACRSKLGERGDLRKKKEATVTYNVYEAQSRSPREMDPHAKAVHQRDQERKRLHETFVKVRRVPFFFGPRPGDWTWYNQVMEAVDNICQFELMNGRPLHEAPGRITEKEMSHTERECTYADLERRIADLSAETPESLLPEDLNAYLEKRKSLMEGFQQAREALKKELVKLGYLLNLAWTTVFLSLGAALCYALHFFYTGYAEHPGWIAAAFGVVVLLFVVGALTAHLQVRLKIESAYLALDDWYRKMGQQKSEYLNHVDLRAGLQVQADIRRRNLQEMQEKMDLFNRHNLQVDRWETFFDGLQKKMDDTLGLLKINVAEKKAPSPKLEAVHFPMDCFPSLPEPLCKDFQGCETVFTCFDKPVKGVVSFVKRFECTRIDKKS